MFKVSDKQMTSPGIVDISEENGWEVSRRFQCCNAVKVCSFYHEFSSDFTVGINLTFATATARSKILPKAKMPQPDDRLTQLLAVQSSTREFSHFAK